MQVVPIFAAPFAVVTLAEARTLNPALAALLAERATPERRDPGDPGGTLKFCSRDDLLEWPEPPVRGTLQAMLAGVSAMVASISSLSAEQFATLTPQARAWFSIVRPNGYVSSTSYPNTAWLAVYCVTAPEPSEARFDSGVLRLHEWRPGTSFLDASQGALRLPYRASHCTWRPVPGEMAVFPAAVTHEIATVRGAGTLTIVMARVRFLASDKVWMPPW
jgi:hypothetical protein